jgi:pyruvate carboxylase
MTFVGPRPELLDLMGDKTAARRLAQKLAVPVLPGTPEPVSGPAAAGSRARFATTTPVPWNFSSRPTSRASGTSSK